jgi:cell division transport system permease protein
MSLLAISTVSVGLFILGAFYLALGNLRGAVQSETQKLDITVLLERDISAKRSQQILAASKIPQVKSARLVPRSQVLEEFKKKMPKFPLDDFDTPEDNPLYDEIRLKLANPSVDFFAVRDYLNLLKNKGVKEVRLEGDDAVRALLGFNRFLFWAGLISSIVMSLATLLIIHNAIRLTIYARRREIRIMELVGATPFFIRIPFVLEGLLYGAVGAIVAALILSPMYAALGRALQQPWAGGLLSLRDPGLLSTCIAWMMFAGLLFGFLGAVFSVSRNTVSNT